MKFKVTEQHYSEENNDYVEEEKTVILPEALPAHIGDEADRMLNAEISFKDKPNNSRSGSSGSQASVKITQKRFSEVTDYLYTSMIKEYNKGDEVDSDKLANHSKKKIAGHYFDQLEVMSDKKKAEGEGKGAVDG